MTELVMNARGGTLYHGLYGEVTPKRGTMQAPGKDFTDFESQKSAPIEVYKHIE